jgi:Kelch motif
MSGQPKCKAIVLAVCLGAFSTGAMGQGWQPEAPLRVATALHRACVDSRGDIYVVGGVDSGATARVEQLVYDPTSESYASAWIDIAPMTTPRAAPAVVCAGDFIYAIGGTNSPNYIRSVERYDTQDPASGWQLLPSPQWLTTPRSSAAAVVDHAGRIYVIGGSGATGFLNTVEVYDPARPDNGWTVLQATLGTARVAHGAVTAPDGQIWVIGGQGSGGTHLDSVEIYDPCNPALGWISGPSITGPNSNNDPATLGADGNIYVAGGWLPGASGRAVRYSFRDGRWQEIYSLAQPRSRPNLVLGKNGRVFAIGGDDASGHYPDVESLNTVSCYADGDISTGMRVLDIFDFLYFQNKYVTGCP